MRFVVAGSGEAPSFAGWRLLMPEVGVGNVGQLAVDVLVHNLGLPRVGMLHSSCVLPVVAANPFAVGAPDQLSTALEVYASEEHKLCVVQQRSPTVPGRGLRFAQEVWQWVKEQQFAAVVLTASLDAQFRRDMQIQGTQVRFVQSTAASQAVTAPSSLGIPPLEDDFAADLPATALVPALLASANADADANAPVTAIVCFCVEGDNTPDAMTMAGAAGLCLNVLDTGKGGVKFHQPPSWRCLDGQRIADELF